MVDDQGNNVPKGFARCPNCSELYDLEIGVCEDCMLAPLKEQEAFEDVGWATLTLEKRQEVQQKLEAIANRPGSSESRYCPRCLEEFLPEADGCADCDADLVDLATLQEMFKPRAPEPADEAGDGCDGSCHSEATTPEACCLDEEALSWLREKRQALAAVEGTGIRICAACLAEYRPGFDRCADCDRPLQDPAGLVSLFAQIAGQRAPEGDLADAAWVALAADVPLEAIQRWAHAVRQASVPFLLGLHVLPGREGPKPSFSVFVPHEAETKALEAVKDIE